MSAELARHLLQTGGIPAEEIHAALLDVVTLGVPFVQALVSRGSPVGARLEVELARLRVPTATSVRVDRELAAELPVGMCARLLAVPTGRARTGEIEVACVDPLDPAVGAEFAQKLGAPVKILHAPLGQVLTAIERWLELRTTQRRGGERVDVPRSVTPPDGLGYALERASFAQMGMGSAEGQVEEVAPDSSGQPVISLVRPKPSSTKPPVVIDPARLAQAHTPDELVRILAELASSTAEHAIVMALRGGMHEARAASPALADKIAVLRVPSSPESVPDLAARDGHFLGRLPDDSRHAALAGELGSVEVYATPVVVSGRPALTLILGGLAASLDATRAADELARKAASVLERILRDKKRGG